MAITGAGELAWWVKHHANVRTRVQIPRRHVKLDVVMSVYNPSVPMSGWEAEMREFLEAQSSCLESTVGNKRQSVLVLGGRQELTPEIAL